MEDLEAEISTVREVRKAVDAVTALVIAVENDLEDFGVNCSRLEQVNRQWGAFLAPSLPSSQ